MRAEHYDAELTEHVYFRIDVLIRGAGGDSMSVRIPPPLKLRAANDREGRRLNYLNFQMFILIFRAEANAGEVLPGSGLGDAYRTRTCDPRITNAAG